MRVSIGGSDAKVAYRSRRNHFKKMECVRTFFSPPSKIIRKAKTVEISSCSDRFRKFRPQQVPPSTGTIWNLESTIKTQRIMCLKSILRIITVHGNESSRTILKDTEINSFIAIMTLLTCLNPFQSLISRVMKLGLQ